MSSLGSAPRGHAGSGSRTVAVVLVVPVCCVPEGDWARGQEEPPIRSGAGEPAGAVGSRVAAGHRAATRSALDAARRLAESGAQGRRRLVRSAWNCAGLYESAPSGEVVSQALEWSAPRLRHGSVRQGEAPGDLCFSSLLRHFAPPAVEVVQSALKLLGHGGGLIGLLVLELRDRVAVAQIERERVTLKIEAEPAARIGAQLHEEVAALVEAPLDGRIGVEHSPGGGP